MGILLVKVYIVDHCSLAVLRFSGIPQFLWVYDKGQMRIYGSDRMDQADVEIKRAYVLDPHILKIINVNKRLVHN